MLCCVSLPGEQSLSGAVSPGLVQALPAVHSLQSDKLSAPASALNLPLGQGVGVSVPASQKCLEEDVFKNQCRKLSPQRMAHSEMQ